MTIEGATVESTAEGDWLHIVTVDDGFVSFELTEDGAAEIIDVLRDWLRERREQ